MCLIALIASIAVVVTCFVSTSGASEYQNCIHVNGVRGIDGPSCLNTTTPCQTLWYVFAQTHLENTSIILQGSHQLSSTLTAEDIANLTIRGTGEAHSTIYCSPSRSTKEEGPGFKFVSVTNLHIINVTLEGCGTLQFSTTVRNGANAKYRSAMYILNSTNIVIEACSFQMSRGKALSFHDTGGQIRIVDSSFVRSVVPDEERKYLFGGGGIYIEYTYCTPGELNCNLTHNVHNMNNSYLIDRCRFDGNRATNNEVSAQIHTVQFRILSGNDGNNAGQGGGIGITFKGTSSWNTISISNCNFTNNSALYGGGIELIFQDYARENNVTLNGNRFINNTALKRAGGALQMGYVVTHNVSHNMIAIYNTNFTNNSAGWGGAVGFFSSRSPRDMKNKLIFLNCTWKGNSASFGAALAILPDARNTIFDGISLTPFLQNTTFIENRVVDEAKFLKSATNELSQHVLESGAVHVDAFTVEFSHRIEFIRNSGSAVLANSAVINLLSDTTALFIGNSGTNGGAMALLGFSILQLFPNSNVTFESNSATELGGAIYATSSHQTEFIYSHKCFISYHTLTHPDDWMSSLTFVNNTAEYGTAIFADSLLQCAKHVGDIITNVSEALQWNTFDYNPQFETYTIATSPATINFTLPPVVAPGERINIHPVSVDDLQQPMLAVYQAHLKSDSDDDVNANTYISDDYIQISGKPNTSFTLTLQTIGTRHVSSTRPSMLGNCPLGFTLRNNKCICSASTGDNQLVGIPACNTTSFDVFLHTGYWAGCIEDDTLVTAFCPTGYCSYHNAIAGLVTIPKSCQKIDKSNVCISHRKGQLCGECEDGYTVLYHSENFKCGRCSYGAAVGLLIYIVAELIPLTLLFVTVMALKLNLTSGLVQSFILFAQTINLINTFSFTAQPIEMTVLFRMFSFLIGFLNLEFFKLDRLSFCLWSEATVLDNLVFHYVTTVYTILLLAAIIFLFKYFSFDKKVAKFKCCRKAHDWIVQKIPLTSPIVHSLSTFLILSYTQYTNTSFQILSRLHLYGEGEKHIKTVVRLNGNVDYFSKAHLPYALPAVLIILFLAIPPPLLLISYPLLWKIKAKCNCTVKTNETDDDTTCWPIRKLLPLIDSFQGRYRDNCRLFAGLLFLWRMILTAIFAFSSNPTEYFLMTEIALLIILSIHALVSPYKKQLYNKIDVFILANMSIINALGWYINALSSDNNPSVSAEVHAAAAFKLLLTYMPLFYVIVVVVLKCLLKFKVIKKPNFSRTLFSGPQPKQKPHTSLRKKRSWDQDNELFTRAAELNSTPYTQITIDTHSTCLSENEVTE